MQLTQLQPKGSPRIGMGDEGWRIGGEPDPIFGIGDA